MRRITALIANPRAPTRVTVMLDGAPAGVITLDDTARLALAVGVEADQAVIDAIARAAAATRVYDRALRLLAVRARSTRELARKLTMSGEPPEHVDAALVRLTGDGLLDDEEFARALARSRLIGRGHAPRRIHQELARRGVARAVADRAIAAVIDDSAGPVVDDFGRTAPTDIGEAIERLARKKLRSLTALDPPVRARRLYAYLARRGYENDDIKRAIDTVLTRGGEQDSP